jgi:RNase P/RNase MRP subunit p29
MKTRGPEKSGNLLMKELIGTRITILEHPDTGLAGMEGVVLDETMGMFLVDDGEKRKKVPKKGGRFVFEDISDSSVKVTVLGADIQYRPEDRNKKLERKRSPRRR